MRPVLLALVLCFAAMPAVTQAADTAPRQAACGGTTNGNPDQDCDGTPDSQDRCPNEPGPAGGNYMGCQQPAQTPMQPPPGMGDSDGDGYPDYGDKCPGQSGSMNGCPDADGDYIADTEDRCPTLNGQSRPDGCPDSDSDGISDPDDACPDDRGSRFVAADGCPDYDGDGVADSKDECTFRLGGDERAVARAAADEKVDKDGCPPWSADVTLLASTLGDMADDPGVHVQCINTKGVPCTFTVTLSVSRSSARKLGLPAKVLDVTYKAKKKASGVYLYGGGDAGFSKKALRAFDRAADRRINVGITLAATIRIGSGKVVSLGRKSFTMTHKDPSGAYRFQPAISGGPGAKKDKPKPEDDF